MHPSAVPTTLYCVVVAGLAVKFGPVCGPLFQVNVVAPDALKVPVLFGHMDTFATLITGLTIKSTATVLVVLQLWESVLVTV